MKSLNSKVLFVAVVALVAFVAVQARADYLLYEDFNSSAFTGAAVKGSYGTAAADMGGVDLTTPTGGQNGWIRARGATYGVPQTGGTNGIWDIKLFTNQPGDGTGIHSFNANFYGTNTTKVKVGEKLLSPNATKYSVNSSTVLEYHLWTLAGRDYALMAMSFYDQTGTMLSTYTTARGEIGTNTSCQVAMIGFGTNTWLTGNTLTAGHWYEIEGLLNFAPIATGGAPTMSLYYRDLGTDISAGLPARDEQSVVTGLQHGWTSGGANVTNKPFFYETTLPTAYSTDAVGLYQAGGYWDTSIRAVAVYDANYVVPEPSTLALLAAGLLGLLAYAWRKRK
jgi:hypothetical protein